MIMKKTLLSLLLFSWTLTYAQATTHDYDLKVLGKTIGNLHVTTQEQGRQRIYTVDSESVIRFFGTNSVKTHQEAVYEDGLLIRSFCTTWKNGKLQDQTKVEKNAGGYTICNNGKTSTINHSITYSAVLLYFIAPHSVDQVFSELEGIFKRISPMGKDAFELADDGDHNNDYTYAGGVLQKIVIDYGLVNILVVLRE